jgi:hypothetical protein
MALTSNGTARAPHAPATVPQEAIVKRVVLSPENAPVTETALVLSDEVLAQLAITAPLPSAR